LRKCGSLRCFALRNDEAALAPPSSAAPILTAGHFHDQMVAMLAAVFVDRAHSNAVRARFEVARQPRREDVR
jgi:hypothetical protein